MAESVSCQSSYMNSFAFCTKCCKTMKESQTEFWNLKESDKSQTLCRPCAVLSIFYVLYDLYVTQT